MPDYQGELAPLASSFGPGLDLGAAACGQSAVLRSAGLEGVQLYNARKRSYAVASDGVVGSSCCLGPALPMSNLTIVTLKPQAAMLLAEVVKREDGEMFVGIDDDSLYYFAPSGIELHLNQLAPLPISFAEKLKPYTTGKVAVPVMHDTVAALLKRVDMLAEVRREAMVEVTVADGRTTLSFTEATNQTEEYYDIVPAGPAVTMPPIRIEARRLATALNDASHLVFDHAADNILVLRGESEFIFAIAGPATAKAAIGERTEAQRAPQRWRWKEDMVPVRGSKELHRMLRGYYGDTRIRAVILRSTFDKDLMSCSIFIEGTGRATYVHIRRANGKEDFLRTFEEAVAFFEGNTVKNIHYWGETRARSGARKWTPEELAELEK